MFSGIVKGIGRIASIDKRCVVVSCSGAAPEVTEGSSVSVSGVCLTASRVRGSELAFDVMPETLRKTTLGEKRIGGAVNLEFSLRAGDEIGGHFVYGHVDDVGVVTNVGKENDAVLVTIQLPQDIVRYMSPQGSVAIDGVSLTIARLDNDTITVSLVPYTVLHTTLGMLKKGDTVNMECDMLAKYIERAIHDRRYMI